MHRLPRVPWRACRPRWRQRQPQRRPQHWTCRRPPPAPTTIGAPYPFTGAGPPTPQDGRDKASLLDIPSNQPRKSPQVAVGGLREFGCSGQRDLHARKCALQHRSGLARPLLQQGALRFAHVRPTRTTPTTRWPRARTMRPRSRASGAPSHWNASDGLPVVSPRWLSLDPPAAHNARDRGWCSTGVR